MKNILLNVFSPSAHTQIQIDNGDSNPFVYLPEDVIIRIFAGLSLPALCQVNLVCKTFAIYEKSDSLWQQMAYLRLFPHEIAAKPSEQPYKDYCKDLLSLKYIDRANYSCLDIHLKFREPQLAHSLTQLQLPNFKVLNAAEAKALLSQKDTIKILTAKSYDYDDVTEVLEPEENDIVLEEGGEANPTLVFHHVAQQQVGDVKFDFLNATDFVISFDSKRNLLINNKLTTCTFTPVNCHLFIWTCDKFLHIFNRDMGDDDTIVDTTCRLDYLADSFDASKINWMREIVNGVFDIPSVWIADDNENLLNAE